MLRSTVFVLLAATLSGCLQTSNNGAPPGKSHITYPISGPVAALVGTASAQVVWRKGYLSQDSVAVEQLIKKLRPHDIIIAKNGHRLTDKILPGYFTHALIWTGNKDQLRRRGLWKSPETKRLRRSIKRNRSVVDVDYRGVRLVHQSELFNSDSLVVVRPKSSSHKSSSRKRNQLIADSLGKRYDFGFDLDTPEELTCSELAARLYPKTNWQYRELLGRRQLLPDDIVRVGLSDKNVKIIAFLTKSNGDRHARLQSTASLRKLLGN